MMNKFKLASKYIVGSAIVIASTLSQSFASYSSLYFDSNVDLINCMFNVAVIQENGDTEYRGEDTHIYNATHERSGAYSNSNKWKDALNPSDDSKPYEAKNIDVFGKWVRHPIFKNDVIGRSKLVTVPAMKLERSDGKVHNLTKDSNKGTGLIDIVTGLDRGEDKEGRERYSMVHGLNLLLNSIEHLKGEYENENDFKNVLMGLAYLMEKEGDEETIVFKGDKIGDANDKEAEEAEEGNIPKDEIEGNGNDITVRMQKDGTIHRIFTVTQEGSNYEFKIRFPIMAYTGYKLTSNPSSAGAPGTVTMTFKDSEDFDGKTQTLKNSNTATETKVTAKEVEFLKLTDLIRHALVKAAAGETGQGKMNVIEKIIYTICDVILTVFESALGLCNLEELIYNSADMNGEVTARSNYHLGMYPSEWIPLITVVFAFVGVISVSSLAIAILRVFGKLTFDSMNVGKRYSLKEDISKILKTIGIMLLFKIGIEALAMINYAFVKAVYTGLGDSSINFLDVNSMGGSILANIVVRIIMVFTAFYINVVYVVRAVNLALLTALAPAFVVSLAFGKDDMFGMYVKEIVGNIFLQSFHAIVLLFILKAQSLVMAQSVRSIFTVVIITLSIVPITKVFKDMVMPSTLAKVGSDMAQKYTNRTINTAAGTVAAAGGAVIGHKINQGDQVREKIAGIGNEYGADAKKVMGDMKKEKGLGGYLKAKGIDIGEGGKLPDDFEEKLMSLGMDDKEKAEVQTALALATNLTDEDRKQLKTANTLEKAMDFRTLAKSKGMGAGMRQAREMDKKKDRIYNPEKSVAKMQKSMGDVMNSGVLNNVADSVARLSNNGGVFTKDDETRVSKNAFESLGMKNFDGAENGAEGCNAAFTPDINALSTKASFDESWPDEVVGMKRVTEEIGKHQTDLGVAQLKMDEAQSALNSFNGSDEERKELEATLEKRKEAYDNKHKEMMTRATAIGARYGVTNIKVNGGVYSKDSERVNSVKISCALSNDKRPAKVEQGGNLIIRPKNNKEL